MLPRDYNYNPSQANPDIKLANVQYEYNPEAVYGEHIINTGAMCNSSASHTYGNVLATIEKFLLSSVFNEKHPGDIFKTVMPSTTLASRQVRHLPHQLYKKELPIMVLVPRIVFGQGDDRFLAHTLINDRYTDTQALWGDGSLIELAKDPRKHIWVHGHYNRALMYVDVVLTFNTYSEQTNWLSYLYNVVGINHPKFIRAPLELYIPKDFCNLISKVAKVPIKNNDSIYEFLRYMNSTWYYPITYKLKGGSNTDEFFMYYISDIDVTIQEPTHGEGFKDGQIRRGFDISFTVRCEFNTVGYFTLNSPDIKEQIHIPDKDPNNGIVTMFSDVINLNDFNLPLGWSVLSWPIFKLKKDENSVSLNNVLNDSLRTVIDYHLKMGLPMDRFINIQFRENGTILNNEMFYIDWGRRELILTNPNYYRTYRLIISVSADYVNNLIKELYNLE